MVLRLDALQITNLTARLMQGLDESPEKRALIEDILVKERLERDFRLEHYRGVPIQVTESFYSLPELCYCYHRVFSQGTVNMWSNQVRTQIRRRKIPVLRGIRTMRGIFIAASVENSNRKLLIGDRGVPEASLKIYTLKGVGSVRSADAARFLGIHQDHLELVREMREVPMTRVEEGHGHIYLYSLSGLASQRDTIYDLLFQKASRGLHFQTLLP